MYFILIVILLSLPVPSAFAQPPDSALSGYVDILPLAVGNQWLYRYKSSFDFWKPPTWKSDSGTVRVEVVGKTVLVSDALDANVWDIREHRSITRHVTSWSDPAIDTMYTIDTTLSFTLVELLTGRHEISLTQCPDINDGVYSAPVFLFGCYRLSYNDTTIYIDTAKYVRYAQVDSSGRILISGSGGYYSFYHDAYFQAGQGLLADTAESALGYSTIRTVALISATLVTVDEESNDESQTMPQAIALYQNYPNPFNPLTHIDYTVPSQAHVLLQIFNPLGELITTVIDEDKQAGNYTTTWNAGHLPSGVYYLRMKAQGIVQIRALLLMK